LLTVAVNCVVAAACTVAMFGESETPIGGGALGFPPHPKAESKIVKKQMSPPADKLLLGRTHLLQSAERREEIAGTATPVKGKG
jgi:hypothetical protein